MKSTLTQEEQALIPVYYNKWKQMALDLHFDEAKAKACIKWCYDYLKKPCPTILVAQSPLQMQLLFNLIKHMIQDKQSIKDISTQLDSQLGTQISDQLRTQLGTQLWDQLEIQLGTQLWTQLRTQLGTQLWTQLRTQLGTQLWTQLWTQLGTQLWTQLRTQLGTQISDQLDSQLGTQISDQLRTQLGTQLWTQLWTQLGTQISDQLDSQLGTPLWTQLSDQLQLIKLEYLDVFYWSTYYYFNWFCFYDYLSHGLKLGENFDFNQFVELVQGNMWGCIITEGLCIISKPPQRCYWDQSSIQRLHNDNGPAIEFEDGWKLYYVHGVNFSETLYKQYFPITESFDPTSIFTIANVEQRAAVIQTYGYERLLEHLPEVKCLDSVWQWSEWLHIKRKAYLYSFMFNGEERRLVVLPDTSTLKIDYILVPVRDDNGIIITTVEQATAWHLRLTVEEYRSIEVES